MNRQDIFMFLPRKILAFLKLFNFDVAGYVVRVAAKRMWQKAYPGKDGFRDDGICCAVDLRYVTSLSQVGRDFLDMMRKTRIPFQAFDMHLPIPCPAVLDEHELEPYRAIEKKTIGFRNLMLFTTTPILKSRKYRNILTPFWEFDRGMESRAEKIFEGVDHLVVFSDFCAAYFRRIAPPGICVSKIRYPYTGGWHVDSPRKEVRSQYGIPQSAFVVFFHFSFGSCYERKNPEAIVRAVKVAFGNDPDVWIVFKTAGFNTHPDKVDALRRCLEDAGYLKNSLLINAYLQHQEILDLIGASDVYMSLHRGEGFGIGMLEAMAVGTPVVCTNFGGNCDFTKAVTAFLVDYDMVDVPRNVEMYNEVGVWPEPRIDEAAHWLRHIRSNPDIGVEKSVRAKAYISDFFSVGRFEDDVRAFLRKVVDD